MSTAANIAIGFVALLHVACRGRTRRRKFDPRMGMHRRHSVARPVEDQASREQNPQQDGPDKHRPSLP